MTARIYPSICRIFVFLAIYDVASWIYSSFSLPAALVSALLQEVFWLVLWNRAPRKLLLVGFVLTEGLALFLLRGNEIFDSLLFAGIAFPCTYLLYHRTVPEVTTDLMTPSRPEKKDLLRLLPLAVLLVLLIYRFQSGDVEKLSVLPLLFLLLMEGARIVYGRFAIRLAGYAAILMLILALLPIPKKPIDWSFAERWVHAMQDRMETIRMDLFYYTSGIGGEGTTGYSGLGRVTDSVGTEKHTELLLTERNVSGQLHLTGAVFSKYEGDHWTGKQEKEDLSWMTEFLDALHRADVTKEEAACFSELRGERITYAYLRTKDRMLPLSTAEITDFSSHRENEVFSKGDAYEIRYLDVDFGSPMLQELIRNAAPSQDEASQEELTDYAKELYGTTLSLEEKEAAADLLPYLDPSGITERMKALSDEITTGADSPYDAALRIEQYLRQFDYKRLTDVGGDLDRFLFEGQEGYCVHFASAMVLLARAQGIPARYCEGYLTRFAEQDGNGNYIVSSADGHAWAEVYIDGFGWVPMEPTPVVAASAIESGWGRTLSTEEEKEKPDFVPPVPVKDTETGEENVSEETHDNGYLRVLLIVVGFLAAFLLLTFGLRFLVKRIAYQRLSNREKAVEEFRALRRKYLAVTREKNQNLPMRETLNGVEAMIEVEDPLLELWYEVRYGERENISKDDLKALAKLRRKLKRRR